MSNLNKIVWIDDNPEREGGATNLQDAISVPVSFRGIKGKDIDAELDALFKEDEPDLIILDHNLEDADKAIFKKGSTFAVAIRDRWPECPIVCVTGENIKQINSLQKASYEEIFPYSSISEYYDSILTIGFSFKHIRKNKPKTTIDILQLLGVPEIEHEKLTAILPTQLKEGFDDVSLIVELSKWIRNTLLKRPGFLYDKLWTSTLLGVNEQGFEKISQLFEPALYRGVFGSKASPKWWKSVLLDILYLKSDVEGLPWETGRGLPRLTEKDYSKCYATGAPYPETVAFIDSTEDAKTVPIKIKDSDIHPEYESLLYFEEIRLMSPAQ